MALAIACREWLRIKHATCASHTINRQMEDIRKMMIDVEEFGNYVNNVDVRNMTYHEFKNFELRLSSFHSKYCRRTK